MTVDDFKNLVGKTIDEANKELPSHYFICVTDENGRGLYRTMDYNPYRICVWTRNDVIMKIDSLS